MTSDQREAAVASHVEALFALGWRWEGRGLVPTIQTSWRVDPKSADLSGIYQKACNDENRSHTVGACAANTVELIQ